jgi:RNA polymerase sigma factor (sigma-70 family)
MTLPPEASIPQRVDSLYRQHHGWLYLWLCKKMGNRQDAADIAHDTFVKLLQQQQLDYQQPRCMLSTIAKNLALNYWRRKNIEQLYYQSLAQSEHYYPSAEEELLAIEMLLQISTAFLQLKPREQQVFKLSQLDELNYQQIADRLNISLSSVKRDMKQVYLCCLLIASSPLPAR